MRNLSGLIKNGARSFAKARTADLTIRKRSKSAYDVASDGKRYVVRFAIENGRALADCAEASGAPCLGFARTGKCYHVARALLFVCAAKT